MRTLNFFKYMLLGVAIIGLNACKKEGCTDKNAINYSAKAKKDDGTCKYETQETETYVLAKSVVDGDYTLEYYTEKGKFLTGYNAIKVKIKKADGTYVENVSMTWAPLMHMTSMSHACPASSLTNKGTYNEGYMVFQMASNDTEYWEITLNYTINGVEHSNTSVVVVESAPKRIVQSFKGTDNVKYILALVEPKSPIVGTNDVKMVLYKMASMTSFLPVESYSVKIDPRMPSMGNHSSPNNVHLTQGSDEFYYGKLNLTMTGYWKINLQLLDNAGTVLKGEEVTSTVEASSIYFEVEF